MEGRRKKETSFDAKAIIYKNRVDRGPSTFASDDIIRWGKDNLYPKRVKDYISLSPTGSGCNRRFSEFCFGGGIDGVLGETIVNRNGETLNDILLFCINNGYSQLFCYALHFNFNLLGEITEIFAVDPSIIRKRTDGLTCQLKDWDTTSTDFLMHGDGGEIVIDLFKKQDPLKGMRRDGLKKYKGQVYMFSIENDEAGYPNSPFHSVLNHLNYEKESQIYQNANIVQGFAGRTIIKVPLKGSGEQASAEFQKMERELNEMHGAENAGLSLIIKTPLNTDGEVRPFNVVEHLTPPNVDKSFVEQNKASRVAITSTCNMPNILIGVQENGMFNQASFADAYNLKATDTRRDRGLLAKSFDKVIQASVWKDLGSVSIQELKLAKDGG